MYVINLYEPGHTLHKQTFFFFTDEEMFKFLDAHKNEKISLYKVGECLLDWS